MTAKRAPGQKRGMPGVCPGCRVPCQIMPDGKPHHKHWQGGPHRREMERLEAAAKESARIHEGADTVRELHVHPVD